MKPTARLRELLGQPDMITAPGAYDGITARLIEQAGFPAVYMTGAGTSMARGFPDFGLLSMSEMAENAAVIARTVEIPVIADADTGYGNELNVTRTVREFEARGVAGIHIEDQASPKRCGHLDGKEIIPQAEFISKIRAAVAARRDPDFLIIARTDSRAVAGFDEAIARANAALAAGAGMAFVEAVQTAEELALVPRRVHGPCLLNIVPGGKTPRITLQEAQALGYRLAIMPGLLLSAVMVAADQALRTVKESGVSPITPKGATVMDTFRRFGADEWNALRQRFATKDYMMPRTLFEKIWDAHVVRDLGGGWALLHIDRHLLHDLSGPPALAEIAKRNLRVRNPELTFAVPDHAVSSAPGRGAQTFELGGRFYDSLKKYTSANGIRFFDLGEKGQGIVHVTGPELGLVLPGLTLICGDSHTCTNGALGALAFGVGHSESTHALATQTVRQHKPKLMRVRFEGAPGPGVAPKDLILHLIGKIGAAAASGHAVEYAGSAISSMSIEGRFTICNLSVELSGKYGIVAPDEKTFVYLRGRPFTPQGEVFEKAVAQWRTLFSDEDARFDREEIVDASIVAPTITWGTSPEHAIPIDGIVPSPGDQPDPESRKTFAATLDYMGLEAGKPIAGTKVDWVFIGSCANSRLSDLREAAALARGRHVAPGVTAWVVPGSEQVKRDCEAEGLDRIFRDAGFEWREPGCSLCVAANGERVPPGARAVSTSNRNFVGRQGPGARTHLASPAMAVAAAVTGKLYDVRKL